MDYIDAHNSAKDVSLSALYDELRSRAHVKTNQNLPQILKSINPRWPVEISVSNITSHALELSDNWKNRATGVQFNWRISHDPLGERVYLDIPGRFEVAVWQNQNLICLANGCRMHYVNGGAGDDIANIENFEVNPLAKVPPVLCLVSVLGALKYYAMECNRQYFVVEGSIAPSIERWIRRSAGVELDADNYAHLSIKEIDAIFNRLSLKYSGDTALSRLALACSNPLDLSI